jgi:hypothetical protein
MAALRERRVKHLHSPFIGKVLARMWSAEKLTVMFSVEVAGDELNAMRFCGKKGGKRMNFCGVRMGLIRFNALVSASCEECEMVSHFI